MFFEGKLMRNVLIVDDHPVVRLSVRLLLEKDGFIVVAETGDGLDAITLIKQHNPDFVVIDLDIPSLNGIDVIKRLRNIDYQGGLLVLSSKDDEHYIKRCALAGADGFVSKKNQLSQLHDALRAICGGYGYFPRMIPRKEASLTESESDHKKIAELSTKELQVLHFLIKGEKLIDIGLLMHISDKTVSTYKNRMMIKLGLKNMVELYDFAQRNNLD